VVVGLAHCILDPRDALIGASGTVFCLIMLAGRSGTIPLTMLLVGTVKSLGVEDAMASWKRVDPALHQAQTCSIADPPPVKHLTGYTLFDRTPPNS